VGIGLTSIFSTGFFPNRSLLLVSIDSLVNRLDFIIPRGDDKLDGPQNVDLLWLRHLVLNVLEKSTVEAATVVGLEVADDASIARLNLRGHVRR